MDVIRELQLNLNTIDLSFYLRFINKEKYKVSRARSHMSAGNACTTVLEFHARSDHQTVPLAAAVEKKN